MSDTRREIAERHALKWLARWGSAPPNAAIESAMSEYAAALLEPPLSVEERQKLYTLMQQWARDTDLQFEEVTKWINERARARAAQERER